MAFMSASGIGCAAPAWGSANATRRTRMRHASRAGALALLATTLIGAAPIGRLDIVVGNMRSAKGLVRVCLTADPDNFPACVDDARAVTRTVPASEAMIDVAGLPHGQYAFAVIHDENSNAKLDTFAGIPREGFGFSRNPAATFGPPRFAAARFALDSDAEKQQVRMRYIF
jgi:uncharacterized protein (DUF2141 family)